MRALDLAPGSIVRRCAMCRAPIPVRPHQDSAIVRTCSPRCAGGLLRQEFPSLRGIRDVVKVDP